MHYPVVQPCNEEVSGAILVNDVRERVRRLEDENSEFKQEYLPFLGRLEEMTSSINESLIGIKGDLKEVKTEVRSLAESHQQLSLDFSGFSSRVESLETIEKDRKAHKALLLKVAATAIGTLATAVVIWMFGLK
jgi:chromosome segregation ATPase